MTDMKRLELATSRTEPATDYLVAVKIGVVALVGICFFNAIIGVFGLSVSALLQVSFCRSNSDSALQNLHRSPARRLDH